MLEDLQDFFNATIDKDGANKRFEHITHDLAWFEDFKLPVVHLEVLFERVADVAIQVILFAELLLLLLPLPLW